MTELNIGGITFSKQEVVKQSVKTKDRTTSQGTWEQYKEYTVTLKDGTKLVYNEQGLDRKAAVDIQSDGSVHMYGLSRAEIIDNDGKNDVYRLFGCEFTNVQAYDSSKFTNDKDKIDFYNRELPDGTIQRSRENKVGYNKGDIVNGYVQQEHGRTKFGRDVGIRHKK